MDKAQTVAKYKDEYLKDMSPARIEKFNAKAVHLQYASLMQWRRKMKKEQSTPQSAKELLAALQRVGELIDNSPELNEANYKDVNASIESLRGRLEAQQERQKARRIAQLEEQRQQIERELQGLKAQ